MSQQRQSTNPIKTTNHILPLSFTNANNTQPQLFYSSVQAPPNYQQQLQQLQQLQQQQQQQQHFLQQVAAPYQRQPQYPQFIPNSTNSLLNQQQQQQQQQQYFRNQAFVNTGSNPNAFFPLVNQSTPPYASNIASPTFFHQQQQLLPTTPSSTSPATTAAAVFMRESESASNGVDDWLGVGADDNVEYDFTVATEAPALSTNATSVAFKENDAATVKDDAFPGVVPESGTSSHGQAQANSTESFQVGILPLEQPVKEENPQFTTHSIIKSLTHQPDNLAAVKVANSATPQAAQYMAASNNAPPLSNHMMQVPRFSQYNAFVPASGHAPPVSNPISIMHTIPIDQSPTLRENMVQSNPPTTASPHFAQKFVPSPILPISESPQQMRRGSIATPSAAATTNFAVTNNNDDISSILSSDLDPAGVPVVLPDSPAAEISSMSQQKFTASLLDFMKKRGATVKIPQWCGRKLDLHALYKLVTQVGGMEAVDRTKKWKSVAEKLSLTDAQSRAHTTLRKHYVNLLAPYEEAHYLPYMRFQPHQVTRRPSMQMSQSPPQSQFVAQAQPSLQSPHTQSQVCPPLDQAQRQSHQQLHKVATSFPTTSMTTTSIPVSYSPSPQLQTIPEVTRYPASHMPSPSMSEQQDHSMGRIDEVALLRSTSQSGFPVQFQPTVNYAGVRNNRFAPYPQQFPTKVQQMQDTRQQQQQLQLQQQQQQQQLQFQQIQQHRYQQQQIQHQQYQQHQLQQQQLQQQMLLQQRLQQQQQQQQQLQQQRQHQQQQQMQQLQGADQRKQQDGQPELNLLQQQKQAQQPERMGKVQTDEQTIKQEQQEGQEQEYNDEQVEHLDLQPQDQQQFQHLKQESSEQKQYQDQEQQQQIQGQQRPRQNSLQHQQIYQHLQLSESRNASSPLLYLPQNSASPSSMVEVPTPGIKQEFSPVQQNISPTAGHFAALPRNYSGRHPIVNNPYTPMLRTVESVGGVDARLLEQNTSRPIYPQLQNLGTIDIHATTMSLKSGLALEVSSALNKLLAISAHPNVRIPFVQCPLLLEALLDILHQGVPRLSKNPMPLQVLRDMVEEENTLASLMVDEFTEPESRSTLSGEEDEDTKRGGRSLKEKREQWVAQALAAITILRNLSMEVAENPAILAGHQRAVPLLARCLVCDAGGGIYTFGMEESEETMKSEVKTEQADDKVGTDGRAEDDRKDSRSGHGLLGLPTFPSLTAKSNDNDGMNDASDLGIGAGDALEFRKSALTILDTAAAHLKLRCTADATFFMNRISDFVSFALQSQQLNTSFGDSPAEANDDGYGDGNTYYAGLAIELYGKASVSDENRNAISGCEREILRRAFRILADSLLGFPMERVEACANPRNTYPFSPPFFSSSTATVLAATVELARLENLLTAIHNTVLLVDDSIIEEMSQYPYFVSCLIRSAIFPRFRSSNAYASQQAYRSPSRSPNPIPPSPSLDTLPVRRRAMATLAQMSKRTGSVRLMHGDAFIAALMDPAENDKPDPEIVAGLLEVLYPGGI